MGAIHSTLKPAAPVCLGWLGVLCLDTVWHQMFRGSLFWQISLIFSYDLCDANHISYTTLHLFQRVAEHKYSAIGKHLTKAHCAWQRSFELKVFQSS